nr:MAG TPA: hypothetical protein [Caudoviricetes sp.]
MFTGFPASTASTAARFTTSTGLGNKFTPDQVKFHHVFITFECVGDFVHHHVIVGDNIAKVQGNHHGASSTNPHIPEGVLNSQLAGFLVIQFQQGIRLGGSAGLCLHFLKILKNTPLVHFLPVLCNEQFPFAGFFIVIGQFDFVIGLLINTGFIAEVFAGFFINQKVQLHRIDVLQGQLPGIIVQNIKLFGIHQGFIKGVLNHIKQGLVFFHDGFKGIAGIFHRAKIQPEIGCKPLQKVGSLQPFFCDGVLVLQVTKLIIGGHADCAAFVTLFLEHKAIEHGGSVHSQLHRITFSKVQPRPLHHGKFQLSGGSLAFQGQPCAFLDNGELNGAVMLDEQFNCQTESPLSGRQGKNLTGINQVRVLDLVFVQIIDFRVIGSVAQLLFGNVPKAIPGLHRVGGRFRGAGGCPRCRLNRSRGSGPGSGGGFDGNGFCSIGSVLLQVHFHLYIKAFIHIINNFVCFKAHSQVCEVVHPATGLLPVQDKLERGFAHLQPFKQGKVIGGGLRSTIGEGIGHLGKQQFKGHIRQASGLQNVDFFPVDQGHGLVLVVNLDCHLGRGDGHKHTGNIHLVRHYSCTPSSETSSFSAKSLAQASMIPSRSVSPEI